MRNELLASVSFSLEFADWLVLGLYLISMLAVGIYFSKRASQSADGFLIADRNLPWWVIGFSNVSTYSDAGGAWVWIFFFGGFMYLNKIAWISWSIWMPLVCIFWAKMWRRSQLVTTGELIEFRYSGKVAGWFRGFYGAYACLVWAVVLLGYGASMTAQLLAPLVGWDILTITLIFGGITLAYTLMSGLIGAAYNDVPQFFIFFIASFVILYFGIQEFGSYENIVESALTQRPADFWQIIPPSSGDNSFIDPVTLIAIIIMGLFMAGSPFAGEGWAAQRFLAARNERHAVLGQMFNALLSLVIRMLPILPLGLLAIALYPAVDPAQPDAMLLSSGQEIPSVEVWGHMVARYGDKAPGFIGLLLAAVLAGYMSTVDTLLQWGSAFIINDLYRRHIRPEQSQQEYIWVTRLVMILMMILATGLALSIQEIGNWVLFINAAMIIPALPLSWLRWFWWRFNVWGEIFAIIISAPLAYIVWFVLEIREPFWYPAGILFSAGLLGSICLAFLGKPEPDDHLKKFYLQVQPPGLWGPIRSELEQEGLINTQTQKREFRLDLLAAMGGTSLCLSATFALFSATLLQWGTVSWLLPVILLSGVLFYVPWLKSNQLAARVAADLKQVPD